MPLLRPRVIRNDKSGPGRTAVSAEKEDKFLAAVIKWIPVEVIAAYEAGLGFIPSDYPTVRLWFTLLLIPLTGLWIKFSTRESKKEPVAYRQVVVSSVAFAIWSVGTQIGIVQGVISGWEPWMGSVTLLLGGFIVLPGVEWILYWAGVKQMGE